MLSPYDGLRMEEWLAKTEELANKHPLRADIATIVLLAWDDIALSRIGRKQLRLGIDIKLVPQILGTLLEQLIIVEIVSRYPNLWRKGSAASEKDLVYVSDDSMSVEIKTSSQSGIYGNRSYAQEVMEGKQKKSKAGYYLAINYESYKDTDNPKIKLIRFGWLDHKDWIGQRSQTGQMAGLGASTINNKLITLYNFRSEQTKLL